MHVVSCRRADQTSKSNKHTNEQRFILAITSWTCAPTLSPFGLTSINGRALQQEKKTLKPPIPISIAQERSSSPVPPSQCTLIWHGTPHMSLLIFLPAVAKRESSIGFLKFKKEWNIAIHCPHEKPWEAMLTYIRDTDYAASRCTLEKAGFPCRNLSTLPLSLHSSFSINALLILNREKILAQELDCTNFHSSNFYTHQSIHHPW